MARDNSRMYVDRSHQAREAGKLGTVGKENLPPQQRRTVSVNSLFNPAHILQKGLKDDVLAPRSTRVAKTSTAKASSLFHTIMHKKAVNHPAYRSFAGAMQNYRDATAVVKGRQLEPVCEELLARVEGLDLHGKTIQIPGLPSAAELDTTFELEAAIARPLEDEQMTIRNKRQNGEEEYRDVRLGDTMSSFESKLATKRTELKKLVQQLTTVDAEIEAAQKAIMDAEQDAVRNEQKAFEAELAALEKKAGVIADATKADVKNARKVDQANKAEMEKKLDQLLKEMM